MAEDLISLRREVVQAAKDALEAFNLKEDQIVAGQANHLVLRMPMATISQGAAARDTLRTALAQPPSLPPTERERALPIPFEAIQQTVTGAMDMAVRNGANSVSMPDHYVAVAHFVHYPHLYASLAVEPAPKPEIAHSSALSGESLTPEDVEDIESATDYVDAFCDDKTDGHIATALSKRLNLLVERLVNTRVSGELDQGAWRPISTAPKDGTRVMLWCYGREFIGAWSAYRDSSYPFLWQDDEGRPISRPWKEDEQPSDWMPLPLPPAPPTTGSAAPDGRDG